MTAAEGLAGLTVGIPAARRAQETAQLVRRWGGSPLVGPTVREVTATDTSGVEAATRGVISGAPEWSVHLTGVGTRRWLEIAGHAGLREPLIERLGAASLIPRGQKAKSALAEIGLRPAWIPESETSEEIADWLGERLRPDHTAVVQLHGEPVPGLTQAILATGARLIEIESYSWDLPEDLGPAEELVRAIVAGRVHALTVTSAPQARFLARVAEGIGMRDELVAALGHRVYLAAVGSVAAAGLTELGLIADLVASPARMGALMRQMAADRHRILAKAGL